MSPFYYTVKTYFLEEAIPGVMMLNNSSQYDIDLIAIKDRLLFHHMFWTWFFAILFDPD